MGVPLQLILGIFLALTQCSIANTANLRQIREAPPPPPAPIQNVTEINNRDLNKIVKDNKTEAADLKAKFVNNVHSYEKLPLKLAKIEDERKNNAKKNGTEEAETSKEDIKIMTKLRKEKNREESSRAIGIDVSKWSPDFHSKNDFTLASASDIDKFQEPPDFAFEGTRHPSFEGHIELTTPKSKIFDQKFKETVESVEQNIEDDDHEHQAHDSEREPNKNADLNVEDVPKKTENESLEIIKTKTIVNNETVEKNSIHKDINLEQSKKLNYQTIFNDTKVYSEETTKGETFEQNYTERSTITTTTSATTISAATSRKSFLLKESLNEKSNGHILSNNIETESTKPVKSLITSTTSSTTKKDKGEVNDIIITTTAASSEKTTTATNTTTSTTVSNHLLRINISDQENNVIPLHLGSESTPMQESSSDRPAASKYSTMFDKANDKNHSVEIRIAIDAFTESYPITKINISTRSTESYPVREVNTSTTFIERYPITETITSTEISETTTPFDSAKEFSDGTTSTLPEEGTTTFEIDNTTETSVAITQPSTTAEENTTIVEETLTTENLHRTSKNLENFTVTEQILKVNERTVANSMKGVDLTPESTVRNELDSTTLNDITKMKSKTTNNVIEKAKDAEEMTTEELVPTSTITNTEITTPSMVVNVITQNTTKSSEATTEVNTTEGTTESTPQMIPFNVTTQKIKSTEAITEVKMTINTTEKAPEVSPISVEIKTTQKVKSEPTTTEYAFIHIENTGNNHTSLLPEILSPNLNYSTTLPLDNEANKIRKVVVDEHGPSLRDSFSSASTTPTVTVSRTTSSATQESTTNVSTTTEDGVGTPTENSYSKDGGGDKGKIAAIAISSVGAVCLVLLAGLLYVMKKRQKRLNYGPRCRPVSLDDYSIDNLSVYNSVRRKGGARISKRSFGNPAFDDPVAPTHPLNFPALAKFSTNFEDIKAEFDEIPQIAARTSELPDGCETKNRYANVIPLPETRVFLKPIDGYPNSDYINANYVTGPKNIKGYYIATQGPMQNTVEDFWRMIWEQQAKVILMLTHLIENGLEKCVDYLPESEIVDCSRLFGDFQIVLKKQEVKDKYIISTLQLKNMVSNSWREVTHFWYLGWPEKGVPAEGNSLIAFLIEARSYMKTATIDKTGGVNGIQNGGAQNEHNPVVVHCSPGTGRTGVAIACDIAIREFETTRLVDIPKIVYRIRRDRAAAVQTKEQYMFMYKVVSLYATKLTGEALENF